MENKSNNFLYSLKDVPGKGKGLVATRKLPKGTRIIAERPLITMPSEMDEEARRKFILQEVNALSEDQRRAFLSLHNIHRFDDDADQYLGIWSTNSLQITKFDGLQDGQRREGIFLEASRINHDCENNAFYHWNNNIKRHTVHAIRDIDAGEEITLSYVDYLQSRERRKRTLKDYYDFTCSCGLCSLPDKQSRQHYRKLEQIVRLHQPYLQCGEKDFAKSPLKVLGYLHSRARLYTEIGREDVDLAKIYQDCWWIANLHGDSARARVFSQRAVSLWKTLVGADHESTRWFVNEVQDPADHQLYCNLPKKWKTAIGDIPQGFSPDDFENWLWKRETPKGLEQPTSLPSQPHFLGFADLPCKDDVGTGGSFKKRHWCFLGEIVETQFPHRLELEVKDVHGKKIKLHFATNDRVKGLKPGQYRDGHTVAILDAVQHVFEFKPPGIRHVAPRMAKVFPLSLATMLALNDKVRTFSSRQQDDMTTCHGCGVKAPAASMKRCSRCFSFWYCSKECQAAGWTTKAHKVDCKILQDTDLRALFLINWDEVQDGIRFPLKVTDDSS
ncbi:hypothetical protein E4U09_003029 [Claviceps aff. purpurea]|uniref:MYND-type zinc finger protein samB n=1 Tax=Claviceps aff. purpurea TaxID=1967640 RepID=A0A9P7QHP1_9HYPO|nr:hypothetical protein E4U09_003029 [Claviceps aff. purpurea]